MTPELPRAPMSAPWASFAAMTLADVSLLSAMPRIAACMVADMLEPVSPSGTGKTLRALIASRCSSNQAAPAIRAFLRSCPSKTLIRRGRCVRTVRGDCSCIVTPRATKKDALQIVVYFLLGGVGPWPNPWTLTLTCATGTPSIFSMENFTLLMILCAISDMRSPYSSAT